MRQRKEFFKFKSKKLAELSIIKKEKLHEAVIEKERVIIMWLCRMSKSRNRSVLKE